MTHGPLHLAPVLVEKPWGGRRLAELGRDLPDDVLIGESWDVADLDPDVTKVEDPASRVATGPSQGAALQDLIARDREALLGTSAPVDGRFPLLVKTLDAREHLSVQVHPSADYVARHPEARLKTESWVIVDAEPDAHLMIGFRDGVTLDDVREVMGTPAMADLLQRIPARPGDVHHLPAGVVHALGAGVVVAEVQTPSDTTFRLYDWTEEYDRAPRELHLDEGLEALELAWEHNHGARRGDAAEGQTTLVDVDQYRIDRYHLGADTTFAVGAGRARIVLVIDGRLEGDDLAHPLGPGGVVLLPADWTGRLTTPEATTLLEVFAG